MATSARACDDLDVGVAQRADVGAEDAHRADHLLRGAAAGRRARSGTRLPRRGARTAASGPGASAQVGVDHRLAGAEGVQARSFVVLHLEQLQQLDVLVGGRHELQPAALVGQQQPDVGVADELGGAVGDHQQELDDVEVVDEGVGDLDEHVGEPFSGNNGHG